MEAIVVRKVAQEEITEDWLDRFERYQESKQWYQYQGEELLLCEEDFVDDWSLEERREIAALMKENLSKGAVLIGAFSPGKPEGEALVGFTMVLGEMKEGCLELGKLHVAKSLRRNGLGSKLFALAKEIAGGKGAEWLFMATNPAYETQKFYRAAGCVDGRDLVPYFPMEYATDMPLKCRI